MKKLLTVTAMTVAGIVALPRAANAQAAGTETKAAEDLAQQAFDAYSRGDFLSSVALYKRAYQTSSAGVILFNIANIYDKKLRDKELALEYYRRYLRSGDTEPDLVKRASERLDVVRAEIEAAKQATNDDRVPRANPPAPAAGSVAPAAAKPTPPPPPQPQRTTLAYVGLGSAVAGVGLMALGGYFGNQASKKNDDAERLCPSGNTCPDDRGLKLTQDAKDAARNSTWLFIGGGVLTAGGVALYIYAPKKMEDRMSRVSLRVTPQLGGLAISGEWR